MNQNDLEILESTDSSTGAPWLLTPHHPGRSYPGYLVPHGYEESPDERAQALSNVTRYFPISMKTAPLCSTNYVSLGVEDGS